MECTQRLECTQDLNTESFSQRSGPEQVGFLGICGQTYPVNLGPNKIGRDPQTCNIILDMKSLSRQHAVINVLNKREYMLMDLGSVNKTKLGVKTLQAYIPYALKNGDTVQFGDVFGIFRLFEEETDLPMTQQCDIPDTPILCRPGPKLAKTLIPESPDVSDKDDSFVASSQPPKEPQFKTPKTHFIKTSGKTVLKPSIGSNKIDNIYWNSSQKSPQLKLDESGDSLYDTSSSENTLKTVVSNSTASSVHEMETQVPPGDKDSTDCIYTASTQLPTLYISPSIHSLNTQIPIDNLPSVHKVDTNEMKFELSMTRGVNSIHDAPTQAFVCDDINEAETQALGGKSGKSIHEMSTQLVRKSDIHNENTQVDIIPIHNAQTQLVTDAIEDEDDDDDIPLTGDTIKTKGQVVADEKTSESDEEILEVFDDIDEAYFSPKKSVTIINEETNHGIKNKSSTAITVEGSATTNKIISPSNSKLQGANRNDSDEEICFEEIDGHNFEAFESQRIVLPELSPSKSSDKENHEPGLREENSQSPIVGVKRSKMRLDSDSSTDCEDVAILPTQNIIDKKTADDDDDTDFEDGINSTKKDENIEISYNKIHREIIEMDLAKSSPILQKVTEKKQKSEVKTEKQTNEVYFDEMATQILEEDIPKRSLTTSKAIAAKNTKTVEESFGKMSTQIIEEDLPKENEEVDFEDMPTQMIQDDVNMEDSTKKRNSEVDRSNDVDFEELPTQIIEEDVGNSEAVFSEEVVSPFKIPFVSPIKIKRKEMSKLATPKNIPKPPTFEQTSDKYYADTQEIVDDLCSQQEPEIKNQFQAPPKPDDEIVLCSDEEFEMPDRFRHIEQISPTKGLVVADVSSCEDDAEEKVNQYVSNLSAQQIKDVVGLNDSVSKLTKKSSSDLSDVELTPKKVHPFKFLNVLLPDSQEIKVSVTTGSRLDKTESSSESETDPNSQENTPILFKKKVRTKKEAKVNLTKKFETEALPTRVLGRVRKPPVKFQQGVEVVPLQSKIFKPKFLTEQEDNIDTDILTENITRLRNSNNNKKKDEVDVVDKKVTDKLDSSTKDKKIELDKTMADKSTKIKKADTSKEDAVINYESINKVDVKKSGDSADKSNKNKSTEQVEETKRRPNRRGEKNTTKSTDKPKDLEKSEEVSPKGRETRRKSDKTKSKERKSNEKTTDKSTNTQPPAVTKGILKNNTIEEIINLESDQEDLKLTTRRPVRSTRGRNKEGKNSATPEPLSKSPEDLKRGPPSKRGKKSHTPPPETEQVRRSKRQRNADSQNDSQTINTTKTKASKKHTDSQNDSQSKITSFMKRAESQNDSQTTKTTSKSSTSPRKRNVTDSQQDQSTVYNNSAECSTDSPIGVKRPASDTRGPSPKRTRSANANTSRHMPLRSLTPAVRNKVKHVLFTAFPNEEVKSKLEELGVVVASDVLSCDVLVTLQIKRTFKLLCVVGLGKPVVGPSWVQSCVETKTIVDPWLHLNSDEAAEKRFQFDLRQTLTGKRQFLKGCQVSSTPSVMPSGPEMKLIVECSGGTWKEGGKNWICVSTERDRKMWPALKKKGATIVSTELILAGVLRQNLDIERNKLC